MGAQDNHRARRQRRQAHRALEQVDARKQLLLHALVLPRHVLLDLERGGPLVLEVNSSPGLEGIEGASGINVAAAVAQHLDARLSAVREQSRAEAQLPDDKAPDNTLLTE